MSNFREVDRQTGFLLPPSVDEWLPGQHLARFVVEVVESLDLRAMTGEYRGSGSASYHPAVLLGILVYGYASGVFSSRKLERATYDSVALRFVAANQHRDHDTIATFRQRFVKQIEGLFVQVLLLAREMGMLKMGTVALDGTQIHANVSRHSALSYEHAGKIEAQLKAEVSELMAKAEAADRADLPDGLSIPDELARRADRLTKLAAARAKIEARAKERFAHEQAAYQAKLAARKARAEKTGKKPRGKLPEPPTAGPRPTDQINLTDDASRIMPVAGGGFDQCYNAQAAVAADSLLVIASDVVQAANDKQQIEPMLDKLHALPAELGIHNLAGRPRLFQCRQRDRLPIGADRALDRRGPTTGSPIVERPLHRAAGTGEPNPVAAMLHRLATRRQEALCAAQTDPGTGVRHHEIGAWVSAVSAAWPRQGPRRNGTW